jgi:hypothetical protein
MSSELPPLRLRRTAITGGPSPHNSRLSRESPRLPELPKTSAFNPNTLRRLGELSSASNDPKKRARLAEIRANARRRVEEQRLINEAVSKLPLKEQEAIAEKRRRNEIHAAFPAEPRLYTPRSGHGIFPIPEPLPPGYSRPVAAPGASSSGSVAASRPLGASASSVPFRLPPLPEGASSRPLSVSGPPLPPLSESASSRAPEASRRAPRGPISLPPISPESLSATAIRRTLPKDVSFINMLTSSEARGPSTVKVKQADLMFELRSPMPDIKRINTLINDPDNVNFTDDAGNTPLMKACQAGLEDVALKLIEKGAFLQVKNTVGRTALDYAKEKFLSRVIAQITTRIELDPKIKGGYRATRRDKKYLKRYKQGKSIGFTMRSSLKAKGLIPRANGTRRVSKKYK